MTIPWGVLLIALLVAAPVFWGRGVRLDGLRDRFVPGRPILTTFCTGVIWGVWHWPLPWVGYFGGQADPTDALWGMLLWLPLSVLLEFLIGWLWSETASVWLGAMLHAGSNLVVAMGMTLVFGDAVAITATTVLLCVWGGDSIRARKLWLPATPGAPAGGSEVERVLRRTQRGGRCLQSE